jgi:ParB-like chromosome segregation protein Spo0J
MNKPEKFNQHQATPSWRDVLPVHPAADKFPVISNDELRKLADDIDKHGLQEPAAIWSDPKTDKFCLLDGRNRLDALALLGRKIFKDDDSDPWTEFFAEVFDDDPVAYVISKNIHRRHLTPKQKDDVIAELLKADPTKSNRQIAADLKVDHKKVAKVRRSREATGEIAPVEKTKGKDGKSRPTRKTAPKAKAEQKTFNSPQAAHAPKAAPKPISKSEIKALSQSWLEVHAQISAGNLTRLRDAIEIHREKINRILEGLAS